MAAILSPVQEHLLAILDEQTATDSKEATDIALIEGMVRQNPSILSRQSLAGHITGSALVMDKTSGEVLLHFHKKLNRWLQFGGHVDDGETDPAQAAIRETQEESGLLDLQFVPATTPRPLDIDAHRIPERGAEPEHWHLDFRYLLVTANPSTLQASAGESENFRWMRPDEALAMGDALDPALKRFIRKASIIFDLKLMDKV